MSAQQNKLHFEVSPPSLPSTLSPGKTSLGKNEKEIVRVTEEDESEEVIRFKASPAQLTEEKELPSQRIDLFELAREN